MLVYSSTSLASTDAQLRSTQQLFWGSTVVLRGDCEVPNSRYPVTDSTFAPGLGLVEGYRQRPCHIRDSGRNWSRTGDSWNASWVSEAEMEFAGT